MAIVDDSTLKSYFETGDIPTQAQYEDFIDSKVSQINFVPFRAVSVGYSYTQFAAVSTGVAERLVTPLGRLRIPQLIVLELTNQFRGALVYTVVCNVILRTTTDTILGSYSVDIASTDTTTYVLPIPVETNKFSKTANVNNIVLQLTIKLAGVNTAYSVITQGSINFYMLFVQLPEVP